MNNGTTYRLKRLHKTFAEENGSLALYRLIGLIFMDIMGTDDNPHKGKKYKMTCISCLGPYTVYGKEPAEPQLCPICRNARDNPMVDAQSKHKVCRNCAFYVEYYEECWFNPPNGDSRPNIKPSGWCGQWEDKSEGVANDLSYKQGGMVGTHKIYRSNCMPKGSK